jgi:metal-responsive CopG/Arc/MetJ family transcriptional regulator
MSVRKFAISVPEEVMEQVDEAAARRGVTRSRFITDVLRRVARVRSDAEVTRRLDQVFGDATVAREQKETNQALLSARRDAGSEW